MTKALRGARKSPLPWLAVSLCAALALAAEPPPDAALEALTASERQWLEEVEELITEEERAAFLTLEHSYQRQRFIDRFWRVRDPFPDTRVNEFADELRHRRLIAEKQYGGTGTDRGRAVLLAGPASFVHREVCPGLLASNEFWVYRTPETRDLVLVFLRRPGSRDPYRLWRPINGLQELVSWTAGTPSTMIESELRRRVHRECPRAGETLTLLAQAADLETLLEVSHRLPRPSPEWVGSFLERTTSVPAGAESLEARLEVDFVGRYKSRTIVQGLVIVPPGTAAPSAIGQATYNLVVDGEVLHGRELFESFRYRFDLPVRGLEGSEIPLLVRRHLRPGRYELALRVHDLNSDRFFHTRRELLVPKIEPPAQAVAEHREPAGGTGPAATDPRPPGALPGKGVATATGGAAPSASTATLLAAVVPEAPVARHILKILPLPDHLVTGRQRIDTSLSGEGVAKVAFFLDGQRVMAKSRPPYSLELDFGKTPQTHILEAVAYGADGGELARDRVPVNSGPQRFGIRLLEPRSGKRYAGGLQAHAEVDLPRGEKLECVEFYLNERKLATLYQPPFVQPVLLPGDERITYVRAVAVLDDGHSAEDLVIINGPEHLDSLQVDFVELYTSVLDRRGHNIEGLQKADFRVFENRVEQPIRRFERVVDLPIHAAIMLDASLSMTEEMPEAEEAALRFFQRVIQPKDRAAVIVFSDLPHLRVPLTSNHQVLAGGLSGVAAEGETALYDSLIFGLYYLAGLRGKRALILLSDGEDSISKYTFREALDFARHSGTAIYTIGLGLSSRDQMARTHLRRLASETGGAHFSIGNARELERVYEKIETELRAQYLIAYQSSATEAEGFREVEVQVTRRDVEVKTIPGYFP